jgi:hypothetical protein
MVLATMALLTAGMLELTRLDEQRMQANFERDADRLASAARERGWPCRCMRCRRLHAAMLAERENSTHGSLHDASPLVAGAEVVAAAGHGLQRARARWTG